MFFALSAALASTPPGTALSERRVGLGLGTSFPSWAVGLPSVDQVGVRVQLGDRLAVDPALSVGVSGGTYPDDLVVHPTTPSVSAGLTVRRYLARPAPTVHLVGLAGTRGSASVSLLEGDDLRTVSLAAVAGVGIEVTPRPWIGVSLDAEALEASWARSKWTERPQTSWKVRGALLSGFSAMVHVYL